MKQGHSAAEKKRDAARQIPRFLVILLGSLFVQCFCWALYSSLELKTGFCVLSAAVTALLYHFVQLEEQTGLSRRGVFCAAVLCPFLLSVAVTVTGLLRHPGLNLLGAAADGVAPATELFALYSARLLLNGIVLLVFAAVDARFLRNLRPHEENQHEKA